jgi:hypothetical protein
LNGEIGLLGLKRVAEYIFQLMRGRPGKDNASMPAWFFHAFKVNGKIEDEFVLRRAYLEVVGVAPTAWWRGRIVDRIFRHNALTSNCTTKDKG